MIEVARILAAPLLWLASFSAVYGLHGIVCANVIAGPVMAGIAMERLLLIAAWLAAAIAQIALLATLHLGRLRWSSPALRLIALATGWTGLAATGWTLFPTIATSHCW